MKLYNLKEKTLGLLYPRVCPVCGRILKPALPDEQLIQSLKNEYGKISTAEDPYICGKCLGMLDFAVNTPRCMKCSRPLEAEEEQYCRDCLSKERYFDRGMAVMTHNEYARKMLYGLKYYNLKDNADAAAWEAVRWQGKNIAAMRPDVMIPVPLHKKRLLKRGYNQAEEIAARISNWMKIAGYGHIPVAKDCLVRSHETSPLKEMSGTERVNAVAGVFEVKHLPERCSRVLLIDDIFTTGGTLNECSRVLKNAGAGYVFFLTVSIGS